MAIENQIRKITRLSVFLLRRAPETRDCNALTFIVAGFYRKKLKKTEVFP
jgi:hypothetical protein